MTVHNFSDYTQRKSPPPDSPSDESAPGVLLMVAPTGNARTLQVLSHVAGYLAEDRSQWPPGSSDVSRSVILLAQSSAYYRICQALGGQYTTVMGAAEEDNKRENFGSRPLRVFDFSKLSRALHEPLPELIVGHPDMLVLVDGAKSMMATYPGVYALATRYANAGSGIVIVGDDKDEVQAFRGVHPQVMLLELELDA